MIHTWIYIFKSDSISTNKRKEFIWEFLLYSSDSIMSMAYHYDFLT